MSNPSRKSISESSCLGMGVSHVLMTGMRTKKPAQKKDRNISSATSITDVCVIIGLNQQETITVKITNFMIAIES